MSSAPHATTNDHSDNGARHALTMRLSLAARIDDVFCGACGPDALAEQSPIWPGDRWRRITAGPVTRGRRCEVEEYVFHPANRDDPELPLAVVWDERRSSSEARLYYSARLLGASILRSAVLPADPEIAMPGVLERYFAALAAGDAAELHRTVIDAYSFRDPSGVTKQGRAEAGLLFESFAARGGISLDHCTVIDDTSRSAVEFLSHSTDPPHAGLGIYERTPDGHLAAARIYE